VVNPIPETFVLLENNIPSNDPWLPFLFSQVIKVAADVVNEPETKTSSLVPSKTIEPPFVLLYVGPLVSVPFLELPLKSVQTVPVPG
jgi:hypothetical protein